MSPIAPASRPRRAVARAAVGVALGWCLFASANALGVWVSTFFGDVASRGWNDGYAEVVRALATAAGNGPALLFGRLPAFLMLVAATVAIPLAILGRTLAVARVRAGFADPVTRVRSWTEAHPAVTRLLVALPAATWLVATLRAFVRTAGWLLPTHGTAYGLALGGVACIAPILARLVYRLTRAGVRAVLDAAPTLEVLEARSADDRIHFDAIADTKETRLAVVAMGSLSLIVPIVLAFARTGRPANALLLGAYIAVAAVGAYAFRRASKVAIGVDGIYVTGSTRTRFLPYTALSGARVGPSDLALLRGAKVVLRLQLYGRDSMLKSVLADRMKNAIDAAAAGAPGAAGQVVATASSGDLARLARGAGDYRSPAVTREQLWSLVEGPTEAAPTRAQAARALSATGGQGDRARLRVAASQCAEPKARVLLEDLATADDASEVAPAPTARRLRA